MNTKNMLLKINDQPMNDIEQLKKLLTSIKKEKRPHIIFKLHHNMHTNYTKIEPI